MSHFLSVYDIFSSLLLTPFSLNRMARFKGQGKPKLTPRPIFPSLHAVFSSSLLNAFLSLKWKARFEDGKTETNPTSHFSFLACSTFLFFTHSFRFKWMGRLKGHEKRDQPHKQLSFLACSIFLFTLSKVNGTS